LASGPLLFSNDLIRLLLQQRRRDRQPERFSGPPHPGQVHHSGLGVLYASSTAWGGLVGRLGDGQPNLRTAQREKGRAQNPHTDQELSRGRGLTDARWFENPTGCAVKFPFS
jgi:hypothetical protein